MNGLAWGVAIGGKAVGDVAVPLRPEFYVR